MPLTSDARETTFRKRNPVRYARARDRILWFFGWDDRELTRGQIRFYAVNSIATAELQEILDDLVAEGVLLHRTAPEERFHLGVSHLYRRPWSPVEGGVQ